MLNYNWDVISVLLDGPKLEIYETSIVASSTVWIQVEGLVKFCWILELNVKIILGIGWNYVDPVFPRVEDIVYGLLVTVCFMDQLTRDGYDCHVENGTFSSDDFMLISPSVLLPLAILSFGNTKTKYFHVDLTSRQYFCVEKIH